MTINGMWLLIALAAVAITWLGLRALFRDTGRHAADPAELHHEEYGHVPARPAVAGTPPWAPAQPLPRGGRALPPPRTHDVWPMSPRTNVPGREIPDPPSAPAGDPGTAPDAGVGSPEPAAPDRTPGPAQQEEGHGNPQAVPSAGPGDLHMHPSWQHALDAPGHWDEHADRAYQQAAREGTGTLHISDSQWPWLAEGQYSGSEWDTDSVIMRALTAADIERMDAERALCSDFDAPLSAPREWHTEPEGV